MNSEYERPDSPPRLLDAVRVPSDPNGGDHSQRNAKRRRAELVLHMGAVQDLSFSPNGQLLAATAGSSVFRHLCIYNVTELQKKSAGLVPVGEVRPSSTLGAISKIVWLENTLCVVTTAAVRVRRGMPHAAHWGYIGRYSCGWVG